MRPEHTAFMDDDMRRLWEAMSPESLDGYQLHGGTALALYLNHRESTDFDFFRADNGPVSRAQIESWPWLRGAEFRGEHGMVDAVFPGKKRHITLNFVSIDDFNGIPPKHPPILAANGVPIGHPVDVLTGKLAAMSNRQAIRDYWDIAKANLNAPQALHEATQHYLNDEMTAESAPAELAKSVLAFPFQVEYELPQDLLASLSRFAQALTEGHLDFEPSDNMASDSPSP